MTIAQELEALRRDYASIRPHRAVETTYRFHQS